jgi:phage baseplate assembly protein W
MTTEDLDREQARRSLLGRAPASPLIFPGTDIVRDLRLASGPDGTDLAFLQGMDTLTQALSVALTTLLGSDVFNTDFGFDGLAAVADETNPVLARERIRVGVVTVLRKEPRVRRIVDVNLGDGRLEPVEAGTRELHVRVAFEAITGDQANVDVARIADNG